MFKFLHTADVHLDSPLKGLQRYEGAPLDAMRQATRRALQNLVKLALDENVSFVLIAGDLYDGELKDFHTDLFFTQTVLPLREARIPVVIIAGNHDAASKRTRGLAMPDNVRLLSTDVPETMVLDDLGVAIHGQGFGTAAVTEDLSVQYPAVRRGLFNIGMLHTCATGRPGHEPYAPCTLDGLRASEYDYWALGHVHKREVLCEKPWVVFPGNTQGRHIRETGPKGCMLVSVQHNHEVSLEFRALDVLRWERCVVDVTEAADGDEVVALVCAGLRTLHQENPLPLAIRVEVSGACPAHEQLQADATRWTNQVRAAALQVAGESLWIEKIELRTCRVADWNAAASGDGPADEIKAFLTQLMGNEQNMLDFVGELKDLNDLQNKLPDELRQGADGLNLDDPDCVRRLLDQAGPLLTQRLLGRGGRP